MPLPEGMVPYGSGVSLSMSHHAAAMASLNLSAAGPMGSAMGAGSYGSGSWFFED